VLFSREGADIAIAHLAEGADAEATRKAVEAEGRRAIVLRGNVADRDFCLEAVARTVDELGGLDVLVNNAASRCTPRTSSISARSISTRP
jgi:NAD(P)-dependent dehydrogenase (short-subunit alcohol dehydrogenase family)